MNPQITTKPAFTVVGMSIDTKPGSPDIPQLWQQQGERLNEIQHIAQPPAAYGVMEMRGQDAMQAGVLTYMISMGVTKAEEIPEGMTSWEVPTGTYVMVETTLPEIGNAFSFLHNDWIPASEYQFGDGPEFEMYGPGFNPHDPASKMSVYIPIKPR